MDILQDVLIKTPYLFLHPMLYIGIILIVLQYRQQISLERKLFSARIHTLPIELIQSLGFGLLGGVIASILMISLGVVFHPNEMWLIWMITAVLVVFHIRFLCLSYATGVIGVIAALVQIIPSPTQPWVAKIWEIIGVIHIPSLIAIVAILHLVEAILIRLQAGKQATPLFVETKRGKLVGGYHLQSFWMLPLFLLVSTGGQDTGLTLANQWSWWPLIGLGGSLTILPVPAIIGYSDLTVAYSTAEKARLASKHLFIYSTLLLGMAFVAEYFAPFQIVAALFAGLAHEGIRWLENRQEEKTQPIYVHPSAGLKVLAVIPGSPAAKMGIVSGEIIKKVNGMSVSDRQELHAAIQQQSAFAKLEVINLAGHVKLLQHSLYTGDHHQLGVVLAPDDEAPYYIEIKDTNLIQLIKQRVERISRGA